MIVPDVARGMALLGIAMANMTTAWIITTDRPGSYFGGIIDDSAWDKAAVVFGAFFVHNRGLPMFSTLLGFGVGLIAMSLWRRGFPVRAARGVIAKRYAFLAVMGAVHLVLLFWRAHTKPTSMTGRYISTMIGVATAWLPRVISWLSSKSG